VHLEHVFKWLNFSKLKSLEITSAESEVDTNWYDEVTACLLLVRYKTQVRKLFWR
jgi:hypothetical protein